MKESSASAAALTSTATLSTAREPCRSRMRPIGGATSAAITPATDTAPDNAVRDQPNSRISGSTKIESVATAGPWRAKPAQHRHARTTQP